MSITHLPPDIEIGRLQRMKEAVLGGKPERRSSIVATPEWIADIEAKLTALGARPTSASSIKPMAR